MSHADYILAILASVGGIFGLALLFAVWRKPGRPVLLVLGWALVAASLVVWFVVNFDRGVAQVASLLMLIVAGAITLPGLRGTNGLQAPVRNREVPDRARRSPLQMTADIGSGIWTFLLAGPAAGPLQLIPMGRIEHVGAHGKTQITSQRLCGGRLGGRALRRSHLACRDSSYGKIPLAKIFK